MKQASQTTGRPVNMNRMPILFQPSKSSERIGQIPIPQNNHENKKNKHVEKSPSLALLRFS